MITKETFISMTEQVQSEYPDSEVFIFDLSGLSVHYLVNRPNGEQLSHTLIVSAKDNDKLFASFIEK